MIGIYTIAMFFISVSVVFGLIIPMHLSRWLTWVLIIITLLASQRMTLFMLYGANVLSPDRCPTLALWVILWLEGVLMGTAVAMVLYWALRLLGVGHMSPWIVGIIGLVMGSYMLYQGERLPPVKTREVALKQLPAALEGLRIAVITDVHLDQLRGAKWCERLVARIQSQQPDLILFLGDLSDGDYALRRKDLMPLQALTAPLGKYGITGNHEYYFDTENFFPIMESVGIQILDNTAILLRPGLVLAGKSDSKSLTRTAMMDATLVAQLAQQPSDAVKVLMAHKPAVAAIADGLGVDLQLSGHTHGGQLPGLAWLEARLNGGFVRGFYTLPKGLQLFVAPGTAEWNGFPFRLYPNELTLLKLKRTQEQE